MAFDIETFRSEFFKLGYLQDNKFEAIMAPPTIFSSNSEGRGQRYPIISQLKFRINSLILPNIALLTRDVPRYSIGPTQKQVVSAYNQEFPISVIVDNKGTLWQFWYDWINSIFNFNPNDGSGTYQHAIYSAEYKDDYATTMQINMFNSSETRPIRRFNIYDVYPTAIKETALDWNSQNQILQLNITLAYRELTFDY